MNRQPRRFGQSGFSLVEVLITLVIVAIGLMGFASMMLNSMKNNRISMQRSMATLYAYDIIDCMRANRGNVVSDYQTDFDDAPETTPTTVAEGDIKIWKDALSSLLPSGEGKISFPSGNTVRVEIKWTETINAGDDAIHTWPTESTL